MIMPDKRKEVTIEDYVRADPQTAYQSLVVQGRGTSLNYALDVMVAGAHGDSQEMRDVYTFAMQPLRKTKNIPGLMELSKHAKKHGCYIHANLAMRFVNDYIAEQEKAAKKDYSVRNINHRRRTAKHRPSLNCHNQRKLDNAGGIP